MIVIKRYPNRKLYNTTAKQYVTLDGIADLIRQGEELQILDHTTGEDLTALTLSQIIFEQEKKRGGFLPHPVLTGLIRAGGQTLGSLRQTLSSPLGLLQHIDREIERRLNSLVRSGKLEEEEGNRLRDLLISRFGRSPETAHLSDDELEELLRRRGVPTRDDLSSLHRQLEELVSQLDQLTPDVESPGGDSPSNSFVK